VLLGIPRRSRDFWELPLAIAFEAGLGGPLELLGGSLPSAIREAHMQASTGSVPSRALGGSRGAA
jgi:hypothetical protein